MRLATAAESLAAKRANDAERQRRLRAKYVETPEYRADLSELRSLALQMVPYPPPNTQRVLASMLVAGDVIVPHGCPRYRLSSVTVTDGHVCLSCESGRGFPRGTFRVPASCRFVRERR